MLTKSKQTLLYNWDQLGKIPENKKQQHKGEGQKRTKKSWFVCFKFWKHTKEKVWTKMQKPCAKLFQHDFSSE